jgi:hypothetical protein
MSRIANTKRRPHNQTPQRPSPRTVSQEDLSLITGVLSPSPSSTPTTKKSGTSSADPQTIKGRKAAKRASHNIIEKRYRTNMNAKFATLEKVITSCRNKQRVTNNRPCSMKKCEILTSAIKCIQNLEDRNAALSEDVAFLREQHHLLGAIWGLSDWRLAVLVSGSKLFSKHCIAGIWRYDCISWLGLAVCCTLILS